MSVFSLDELEMFERSVARFIAEDYAADRRLALVAEGDFGREEWRTYKDLGWLSLSLPEEYGGLGGGLADLLTILYAAGRGLLMEPLVPTLVIGARLIERLGNAQQKSEWLPRIGSGELILGFAHTDNGAGETDARLQSTWNPERCAFRLCGTKRAILHGSNVDRLLVTARDTADHGVRLFLLDPKTPGLTMASYRMIDDQSAADMECHDVYVSAAESLAGPGIETILERTQAAAAIASAAESVGAMEALNAMTLDYVKVRKQFGRALGNFQVLQHRLVDMMIAAKQARALVKKAACAWDANSADAERLASASKVIANRAGRLVGEQAIQTHGGIGMTEEYLAGHYLKRLLLLGAQFGDADYHLRRLATADRDAE